MAKDIRDIIAKEEAEAAGNSVALSDLKSLRDHVDHLEAKRSIRKSLPRKSEEQLPGPAVETPSESADGLLIHQYEGRIVSLPNGRVRLEYGRKVATYSKRGRIA